MSGPDGPLLFYAAMDALADGIFCIPGHFFLIRWRGDAGPEICLSGLFFWL